MRFLSRVSKLADGRRFYFILGVILVVGVLFRTINISADAPIGFTKSQDVSTDPFAYTYFAENAIDYGDANPFDDSRWIVYEKSTQTVAAYLVYSVLGTGRAQGNLTAAILNLLAILLISFGMKNFGSRIGALLFALIACTNFTLSVFARIPFLEASQNFWLAASFYLFSHGERRGYFFGFAGAATAAAAFFGKMIALYAAGFFMVAWVFQYLTVEVDRKAVVKSAVIFYASYAAVGVFWFLFTYLPSASEVSSYYAEQGVGLYGAPRAFGELKMFFWQVQNLLWERRFVEKLPFVSILASISGAVVIWYLAKTLKVKRMVTPLTIGWVLLLFWLVFAYTALFPFNYRPLRYQTTLMFPMMALAGIVLALPFEMLKAKTKKKKSRPFKTVYPAIGWSIWLAPILCSLYLLLGQSSGSNNTAQNVFGSIYLYTFLFAAIGFCLAYVVKYVAQYLKNLRIVAQILVVAVLLGYLAVHAVSFASWMGTRQYSLISADRDLGAILGVDAVLSGSYASALTQENKLRCIHHQFGVEKPDLDFFKKFPITHLLIDPGNEERARKDYPGMMSNADLVTSYAIRGMPVKLYRISEASPNPDARIYSPTDFELMKYWINRNNSDSATVYLDRFMASDRQSYSAEVYLAESYSGLKQYEAAIDHYQSALHLSPGDVSVAYGLGLAFANASQEHSKPTYIDSALVYLDIAHSRIPQNTNLKGTIDQLRRMRR